MIELPWPPRELSPNARVHYHAKARAAKTYRDGTYWIARAHGPQFLIAEGVIPIMVEFFPPDRRHRDDDNMIGAFKAGRDGIADALAVNDRRFRPSYHFRDPIKGGKIVVTVMP